MKDLLEKAAVAETSQHRPTAEDILKTEESAEIVAFLLKSYFGQQAAEATKSNSGGQRKQRDRNEDRQEARGDGEEEGRGRGRRRRRRRGGRDDGERNERNDRNERGGRNRKPRGERNEQAASSESDSGAVEEGMRRLKVNIGFDDGFKGRGAIAKKITSLAGLNDGIVSEIESKRNHAVLKTTPEVADLLVERVDGAQIGKKILSVSIA